MKRKFFFLLMPLLSINTLFVLLNGCGHNASTTMCSYFKDASLDAMDNADSTPHLPASGGVAAKAFLLALTLNDTEYSCMVHSYQFPENAAYAEHFDHVKQTPIDSIVIISNHDFDAGHPAGSDLKSLFNISDTAKLSYVHGGSNNFYLLHSPADTGTHIFTMKLFAADSSKNLTATSLPVKLLL